MIDKIRPLLNMPDGHIESRSSQMISELSLAIDRLDKPCPNNPAPNNLKDSEPDNSEQGRFLSLNFIFLCFLLKIFV